MFSRLAAKRTGGALAVGALVSSVIIGLTTGSSDRPAIELSNSVLSTTAPQNQTSTTAVSSTRTSTVPLTTTLPPRAEPGLVIPTGSGPLDGRLIVVDPGHNGANFKYGTTYRENSPYLCNSTGATAANGTPEVQINWAVGQALTKMLTSLGASVLLTHADNDGFGPCADERGALARDNDAAAFISIHADGSTAGGSGFHIIHPATHTNLSDDTVRQSKVLASMVRNELIAVGGRPANYVGSNGMQERDDLANLNTANRPSILAELGNIRNPVDGTMLTESSSQVVIAAALARGLLRLFGLPTDAVAARGDINGDSFPDLLPNYTTSTTIPPPPPISPITPLPPVVPGTGIPKITTTSTTTSPSTSAAPPTTAAAGG